MIETILPSKAEALEDAMTFLEGALASVSCPMKTMLRISMCFEEIFVNVARYAYADRKEEGTIKIRIDANPSEAEITIIDSGLPFNPLANEDPNITLSAEERGIGGLGILMVKKTMDETSYEYLNGQNVFRMKKRLV